MLDHSSFILAGNGPYENRGCEAIVRGTAKILREYFNSPDISCFYYSSSLMEQFQQFIDEHDSKIVHNSITSYVKPFSKEKLIRLYLRFLKSKEVGYRQFNVMDSDLKKCDAVLSVGGDNYSLDYGIPKKFTNMDEFVQSRNKPIVIWGASIGPFDTLPEYESFMLTHLRKVTAIFSRESSTTNYLNKNGIIDNVYNVADPAYLLDPIKPDSSKALTIEEGSIGINLSPLMAKYVCGGDVKLWEQLAAKIISSLSCSTNKKIYLIPHVTITGSDDFLFLKNVYSYIDKPNNIVLINPIYNASETKWIISQLSFFAGSRMHSTIASLSSGVPTLSFSYSMKSKGINQDLFGHDSYCLSPVNLNEKTIDQKVNSMITSESKIVEILEQQIPCMKDKAMDAGKYLRQILE